MNRHGLNYLRHFLFASLAALALTACTLYMDEPESSGDYLRTEAGYLDDETIELPDNAGTIRYKYNQNTIPVNDEILEYLVKVESDTILYFTGSMPDDILPDVGSMMTCTFTEQFPHAFCHKCIERTEENGIYRCVFTKCGLDEAFDELLIDADYANMDVTDPSTAISEEEFDSIMAQDGMMHADDGIVEEADSDALVRGWRAPWRQTRAILGSDEEKAFGKGSKDSICTVNFPTVQAILEASAGDVASVKGTAKLPVHVTPLGIQADFIVVGIDIGFTVQPYIKTVQELNITASLTYNYDVRFGYFKKNKDDEGEFKLDKGTANSPIFKLDSSKEDKDITLSLEAGYDFHVGLGADLLGTGFDVAVGCVASSSLDLPLDTKKFKKAEDFKQECLCDNYFQLYAEGCVKALGAKIKPRIDSPKYPGSKKLAVPFFPVIKSWDMKCTDTGQHKYSGTLKLKQIGILTSMLFYTPMVRVYNWYDELGQSDIAAELPMKMASFDVNGFADRFELTWVDKDNVLDYNYPYYVQAGYQVYQDISKKVPMYWIPLAEHEFEVQVPEVHLKGVSLVRTLSSRNAPKYTTKNGYTYRYCYVMDVELDVKQPKKTPKWGFTMSSGQPPNQTVVTYAQTDSKHKPTVLMFWYSNKESVDLKVTPQAYFKTGQKVSTWPTDFEAGTETVSYSQNLDINPDLRPFGFDSKATYIYGQ